MPLIVLEFVEFIGLPVDCIDATIKRVSDSGYLKGEDVIFELVVGLPD
jgi:hypothetical protein